MDMTFVSTLIAVIDDGSIAAAARRMHVTPGAVALRIKALEREFGASLLTRAGHRNAPTSHALRILPALRELVEQAARIPELAAGRQCAGELRLGTIATASTGLLPSLLASFTTFYPAVDLLVEPGASAGLRERVLAGELDAAIIVRPPQPLRKSERFERWLVEPLTLAVPPSCAGDTAEALLRRMPYIRYDRRSWGGQIADDWLKGQGIAVQSSIELDSLDGIVAMVAAGLGVSIIPDWYGPRPQGCEIVQIRLLAPTPERHVGLYSRTASPKQELVDLFMETHKRSAP